MRKIENTFEYIQYGCGLCCPETWQNFDASPRLLVERLPVVGSLMHSSGKTLFPRNAVYGDIVTGLPVAHSSVSGVYCSHVLEHLDRTSIIAALENTLTILKPGGTFRLVVPDLAWRAQVFLEGHAKGNENAADTFMRNTYLGVEARASGIMGRLRRMFGNSDHRWMYDYAGLSKLLQQAGFDEIRLCEFGDADDPMFKLVEEEGRFFDTGHRELAIEAKRPIKPATESSPGNKDSENR